MAVDQRHVRFDEACAGERGEPARFRWYNKAAALLYVFFCFELGVFLLLFPWLDIWDQNYFAGLGPGWEQVWNSPYLRGAVSGLGVIDIGISFSELFRLRRFASSRQSEPRP